MSETRRRGWVYFRDELAGQIYQEEGEFVFKYNEEYLNKNRPSISFTLPLRKEPYRSKVLFPFFDGLIPEGWLLELTTKTWKLNPRDRMGLLLTACRDTIGAVSVRDEEINDKETTIKTNEFQLGGIETHSMPSESRCLRCYLPLKGEAGPLHSRCSQSLFGYKQAPIIDLDKDRLEEVTSQYIKAQRKGLTGVQKKLSVELLAADQDHPRLTLVGLLPNYILKPQSDTFSALPEIEDLTMSLAELCGITCAKHSLLRLKSGDLAFITLRFDRLKKQKLAMEDMAQITEVLTENKYFSSVEKIGKATLSNTTYKGNDLFRLLQLVVFCYLTGNTDMHLKNYSLLTDLAGTTVLSPAYDLVATKLVIPEDPEESALTISGKKRKLKRTDFESLSQSFGLNERILNNIMKQMGRSWKLMEQKIDQSFVSQDTKNQFKEIISKGLKNLT